jgi:hypothetical protein
LVRVRKISREQVIALGLANRIAKRRFDMHPLLVWLFSWLTFSAAIATSGLVYDKSLENSDYQHKPCEKLIRVQSQVNAPVIISPMSCDQQKPQPTTVGLILVNTSKKAIRSFTIKSQREYTNYKEPFGDGLSLKKVYTGGGPLAPGWSDKVTVAGDVITKAGGIAVGPLTQFSFWVESVTFEDGSTWNRTR